MGSLPRDYGLVCHAPHSESALSMPLQADIVVVHGINGDPSKTWVHTDSDGSICWVSSNGFLPTMLPHCRIFTFRWNASILHYNSDADIKNIASSLLSHIGSKRVTHEEQHRRLLFVCHSLGGLVVQRALTLDPDVPGRRLMQDSTTGIIFLGTPHGGSDLARVMARLSLFLDTPKALLDVLSVGSASLTKVTDSFKDYYRERRLNPSSSDLEITSFGEMQRTRALKIFRAKVVPLKYAQLRVKGEVFHSVEKDHRSIARFKRSDDPVFTMIWHQLRAFLDKPALPRPVEHMSHRPQIYHMLAAVENFTGQQYYLTRIRDLLCRTGGDSHSSVALWGIAGIGKTELAMQYAAIHRHEYQTIKVFNAASEMILKAGMEDFYDYLIGNGDEHLTKMSQGHATMKCSAVVRWFEEEKEWLIIFDNIDMEPNIESRQHFLQQYFPSRGGHRIIISRSGQIRALAQGEIEISGMNKDDAIEMLLKGSDYSGSGQGHRDNAALVVEELDRIPGFIEMGANYLRKFQDSPHALLKRIQDQKNNMRLKSTQLVLGDAFAIWDITYERLQTQSASLILLKLLAHLEGFDICDVLLTRAWKNQSRWGHDGQPSERTPEDNSVDPEILEILRDDDALNSALKPLMDASFIRRRQLSSHKRIEIRPLVQQYVIRMMTDEERLQWTRKTICFVSHCFPEENCLEENYDVLRSILTPHVFRCLDLAKSYTKRGFGDLDDVHEQLCYVLLSALGRSGKERWLLDYTDSLLKYRSDVHNRCLAAKWRAYVDFNATRTAEAETLLSKRQQREQDLLDTQPALRNPLNNASIGDVVLHQAQCLFSQRNYSLAKEILEQWHPTSGSMLETRTQRYIDTAIGRSLLFLSQEDQAIGRFQNILADANIEGPLKALNEFNWVAVTLGQLHCKNENFADAVALVKPRCERLILENMRYDFITSDFRIILCEAYLRMPDYDSLKKELDSLQQDLTHPAQIGNPRAPSQLLTVKRLYARSLYLQALENHRLFPQALNAWRGVLKDLSVDDDKILSREFDRSYDTTVAIYSIALVYSYLGDHRRALEYVAIVEEDQKSFEHPNAEIDYSLWFSRVQDDFATFSKAKNNKISFLRSKVPQPLAKDSGGKDYLVHIERHTSEFDFTEKSPLQSEGCTKSGDCKYCQCDLLT